MLLLSSQLSNIEADFQRNICYLKTKGKVKDFNFFFCRVSHASMTTETRVDRDIMESQRCELEQYLKLQNDWLRTNLLYQSKQHVLSLMSAFESKASFLLSQNDEELRRTRDQVSTLGERLKREMEEKEAWKRIASEKEAMVISMLNSSENMQTQANIEEEVGSSINVLEGEKGRQSEVPRSDLIPCKACGTRSARILLLPCRHLCACEHCAPSLDACPVCQSEKIGSIEVSLD